MSSADYDDDVVEVCPDCWPAVELMLRMQTQWSVGGMGSPVGLRYDVLFRMMDRLGLSPAEYDQLEDDVRVMELEALSVMAEQSKGD